MANERKWNVISDDNCKAESMTKEEIIAAIVQYMESHEITDVDTGFITTLKEQNHGTGLTFWVGTQAEYNALAEHMPNCFYIISDDSTVDDLEEIINGLQGDVADLQSDMQDVVGKNGVVLLNQVVPYGTCDIALSGEYHLSSYSIVKVMLDTIGVLCSVSNDGETIYVNGFGIAPTTSAGLLIANAINLTADPTTNKLKSNSSVTFVAPDSASSVSISKIIGIC